MRRIEKQTSQQRIELENAKKYQAEQNLLRQNYNQKGKDIEKAQLNSIKERVWKKHKQTLQRRKKQLKEVAPPNTWEVYTMNQASRTLRSSFFLSPINQKKKGEEEDGDRDREGDVASNQKQNNETEGAEKKEPGRVERRVGDTATYSSVGLRVVGGRALGPCVYAM